MGLDSVELVMEWEKFFNFTIPDPVAGRIRSMQDAADEFSQLITFSKKEKEPKEDILRILCIALVQMSVTKETPAVNQKIFQLVSFTNKSQWNQLSVQVGYELPVPVLTGAIGSFLEKIIPSKVDHSSTTIDRFADLICAFNYKKIFHPGSISSKEEVMLVIMGITGSLCGVNVYEMAPEKTFANDFGID